MIKRGYLSKTGGRVRKVKLIDVVTLLHNIHVGAQTSEVGFEDARETITTITSRLSRSSAYLDPSLIESGLWSANLLNEKGKFWDPNGRTFEEFVREVLGRDGFDMFYNTIERK